ncbi:SDR family NAD(P)-dependent oxidoreductase [Agrobacterium sp. NPDC090283]|uniref:SDR family NAD(P)-dependent oxidoreductase n=1 Tax=Agrobacterium sp. NPDC090283 TaxID=3363920 RepID=UPI00383B8397
MTGILKGKVALITAAGMGIGRAAAIKLASEGATVYVTDRDGAAAAETIDLVRRGGWNGDGEALDVADFPQVQSVVARCHALHGKVDILHSHAGIQLAGGAEELTVADFERSVAVNVTAQIVAAKAVIPIMTKQRNGGVILNTASNAGVFVDRGMLAYNTTKAAVVTMTRQLALDYGASGIRVNALCPGWVDTPFNRPYQDHLGGREALESVVRDKVPLGRFGTVEEIADAILFLVSPMSSYITGQALVVDGGESIAAIAQV